MRSVAANWSKGSIVAVDAGVHLSAIARLLQEAYPSPPPAKAPFTLASGPFAGLELPHVTVGANAAYIARSLVDTYLITHPHLDHISGLVVNTAGLPGSRPKKLAGLPSTIQAFKSHIFNNVIWPNLSDENNGAGLLTYMRLVEGGSPALGDGEGRGYMEVCDGLLVKTWSVSHGHCIEKHPHRGSASSASPRYGSHDALSQTPRRDLLSQTAAAQVSQRGQTLLSQAALSVASSPQFGGNGEQDRVCVYDSSAYFIQDHGHQREVLIFGDVEPDSISLSPRNLNVWQEAAPKIAAGTLAAIFIECSYDDSQSNDRLFGHQKPCFIIEEMRTLASEVEAARKMRELEPKKRKRGSSSANEVARFRRSLRNRQNLGSEESPVSPKSVRPPTPKSGGAGAHFNVDILPRLATNAGDLPPHEMGISSAPAAESRRPLAGLKVVIIHVKERLDDGPPAGESILEQLLEHEREEGLGCEFVISRPGMSFYF